MFDFAEMLRKRDYGDLVQEHGLERWPSSVPFAHRQSMAALLILFAASRMSTQVDKTLLAIKYLNESRRSQDTVERGVIEFTGDHGFYLVDLNHLTCTCPLYQGQLKGKAGMCSHLMVSLVRYGLTFGLNPVDLLHLDRPDLLEAHPQVRERYATLSEGARSAALVVAAAFVIGAWTATLFNSPLIQQYLLALDHDNLAGLVHNTGRGRYNFRGVHDVDLYTLSCTCSATTDAMLCEGILAATFTRLQVS
jgi:SWIM zinc finger